MKTQNRDIVIRLADNLRLLFITAHLCIMMKSGKTVKQYVTDEGIYILAEQSFCVHKTKSTQHVCILKRRGFFVIKMHTIYL